MTIKANFYNSVISLLDAKYFPALKSYRDSDTAIAVHHNTELFNNGCLSYEVWIKRLSLCCCDTEENIKVIVNPFINF